MSLADFRDIVAREAKTDPFVPVGSHTQDTTIDTATTISPPAGATKLLIQAYAQNIRYRLDGTDPTTTVGFRLQVADGPTTISVASSATVIIISETAGAVADYQWGT